MKRLKENTRRKKRGVVGQKLRGGEEETNSPSSSFSSHSFTSSTRARLRREHDVDGVGEVVFVEAGRVCCEKGGGASFS